MKEEMKMPRYIDVDLLDDVVMDLNENHNSGITRSEYKRISGVLWEFPTADVVEVVRCKDCKYAHTITFENGIHCLSCNYQNAHGMLVENHGFCYWGERREDNGKQL